MRYDFFSKSMRWNLKKPQKNSSRRPLHETFKSQRLRGKHPRAITLSTSSLVSSKQDKWEEALFFNVSECWKFYSKANWIVDVKESGNSLKYAALNGCWKKLWLKLLDSNFQKFTSRHNERRNVIVLACQVPDQFPDLEEVDIQKVLHSYAAE